MAGVNKVVLLGNLGVDPEVRYTPQGTAVANFRIATNETWTDKSGNKQERTEWHRIVVWGKLAELSGEYLTKGRQVYLEGKLQTREWTNKENQKQYTTEIVAQQIVFLGGNAEGRTGRNEGPANRIGSDGGGDDWGPPPSGVDEPPPAQGWDGAPQVERNRGDGSQMAASRGGGATFPFGRQQGQPIHGASLRDLEFYANASRRTLADPSKSQYHAKERQLLAAYEAELARQGGGGAAPAHGGPSEDDIPF